MEAYDVRATLLFCQHAGFNFYLSNKEMEKKIAVVEMTEHDRIDLCQSCIDSLSNWFNYPADQ